ncbi:MAG: hypothetical protein ACQER9_01740 [Nanobdellota archaeon]
MRESFIPKSKKKSIYFGILFSVFLAVLLMNGCTTSGSSSSPEGKEPDYRKGAQALEMQFTDPGTTDVYEGDELTLITEYFNKGTSDIVNGEFFVSGYDLNYMTLMLDPKFINIEGKDEYDPQGTISKIMTIKSNPLRLPENSQEFTQTIKLTGCYDYTTYTTAEICVDPDANSRRVSNKICTMNTVSPGAQGSPIVVTRVEPIVSKNDFRLNIEFSNQGNGDVYDRRLSNAECFADLDRYEDLNKVDVTRVEFSGIGLNCQPKNPIRLIKGRGKVTCECKGCINEYMDAYKTQVIIELDYGYRNEITKNIRVLED